MHVFQLTTIVIFLICFLDPVAADWPQFRGPNSSGVTESKAPIEFGPGLHELWSIPVEPGHSSPCIAGDSIFLTTFHAEKRELAVVCLARADGSERWRRTIVPEEFEKGHPSFNPASSSPATDGECVVAYFGSFGLVCFDMDGTKRWEKRMPLTKSYAGNAASPAIVGDRVILYRGNYVDHFLLALDKSTGEELWKVDQEEPFTGELACTACPIVREDLLIVHTARSVQGVDIATGKQQWVVKCATTATSTPVLAGDTVLVAAWNKMGEPALRPKFPSFEQLINDNDKDDDGLVSSDEFPHMMIFHRPDGSEAPFNGASLRFGSVDKNKDKEVDANEWSLKLKELAEFRSRYDTHGVLAIPINGSGLIAQEDVRTLETQGIPEVPSPLVHDGLVYFVKNGGVLTCINLKTGKRVARIRTKGKGTHYASPIIAGNRLYSVAGNGVISVLSLGSRPKVIAVNDMKDATYASPAVVDGTLYIRTHKKLYAFQ